ncbi:MAG: hypothetical protein AB8F78_16335 [Saprospiraceae bacterium]
MKNSLLITIGLSLLLGAFLLSGFTPTAQFSIDEIRMCSLEVEKNSCPVDNPVFQKTSEDIYISVVSKNLTPGTQMRFTWFYIPADDYFSTFLGSVYETTSSANVIEGKNYTLSHFPKDIEVQPGNYEVVIHTGENEKPILKTFKVLD